MKCRHTLNKDSDDSTSPVSDVGPSSDTSVGTTSDFILYPETQESGWRSDVDIDLFQSFGYVENEQLLWKAKRLRANSDDNQERIDGA